MFNKKEEVVSEVSSETEDTIVGNGVNLTGELNSKGNIRVSGNVSGKINTEAMVTILAGAKIDADINAGNAQINGIVNGNITIKEKLIMESKAVVKGNVQTGSLRIDEGAIFSGECRMDSELKNNE